MRALALAAALSLLIIACGGDDASQAGDTTGGGGEGASGQGGKNAGGASEGGAAPGGGGATGGGGDASGGGGASQGGGGAAQGGGAAGGGGSGGASGVCPAAPVDQGDFCDASDSGLWCTWGDDARYGCRATAQCQPSNHWNRQKEPSSPHCNGTPPTCPTEQPNGDCTTEELGLTCVYEKKAFTCAPCSGTLCMATPSWHETTVKAGCPEVLPNMGDACDAPHLKCDYNNCAQDQAMFYTFAHGVPLTCEDGVWTLWDTMMFCP